MAGTSEGSLPSKLPNLLAAGVPVFAICEPQSEIVRLLRQAGASAGDHADSFDAAHLQLRFESLLQRVRGEPRSARVAGQRSLVERLFAVEPVVNEILDS
jgi:colanic acid biosynthesis glycosyl transferase WcaI